MQLKEPDILSLQLILKGMVVDLQQMRADPELRIYNLQQRISDLQQMMADSSRRELTWSRWEMT